MNRLFSILHTILSVLSFILVAAPIAMVFLSVTGAAAFSVIFRRQWRNARMRTGSCGIIHPFASDGGGGERVLWHTVHSLLTSKTKLFKTCTLYHNSPEPHKRTLGALIVTQFGLNIPLNERANSENFRVIGVNAESLRPGRFSTLTLFRQGLASILFVAECLHRQTPQVVIDTIGVPFAYPLCRLVGVRVISYVHYPFICADRLETLDYAAKISCLNLLRYRIRSDYLRTLLRIYEYTGSCVHRCAVNSSWTHNHMTKIWKTHAKMIRVIFPPVSDVQGEIENRLSPKRIHTIVSLAQFRREKNHSQQLRVFQQLLGRTDATLVIAGSVRGATDHAYLRELQGLADNLGISHRVAWQTNLSNEQRRALLRNSLIGLHTMVDEHFGISIVEYMAAGCLTVAHASGGPKSDIICPAARIEVDTGDRTGQHPHAVGFLAASDAEYLAAISHIIAMHEDEKGRMRQRAMARVQEFTSERFGAKVMGLLPEAA